jgi:beta-N-acetylhexosaminidase
MKVKLLIISGVIFLVLTVAVVWLLFVRQAPTAIAPEPPHSVGTARPQPILSHVDTVLAGMSLRDKVASLLILHSPGVDTATLQQFMVMYKPGGFILMGDNIPSSDTSLQMITAGLRGADKQLPYLVAIDQEGGTVRRLVGDTYASETLKGLPVEATTKAFSDRSSMVQSVGITLNFGIIADTTANTKSFIYDRVLGTSPQAAAERVAAAVTASKGKTLSTLKHFPGHGETTADSHSSVPTTALRFADWQARDEPPFKAGVAADADMVMFGHLRYSTIDNLPASLSKKWHDILKNEVGFNGVTITDDMQMLQNSGEIAFADPLQNAIMALQAGNTMLLYVLGDESVTIKIDPSQLIDGIISAVQSGKIASSIIDQDAKQVLELRAKTASIVTQ